jgi:hypothetical protein
LAARELSIYVVAPFNFEVQAERYACLAWLPDFGGPHGMVVAALSASRELRRVAGSVGQPCSFVNPEVYRTFNRRRFIETLLDWGFTGPQERRPPWVDDRIAIEFRAQQAAQSAAQRYAEQQGWHVQQIILGHEMIVLPTGQCVISVRVILEEGADHFLRYEGEANGTGQLSPVK